MHDGSPTSREIGALVMLVNQNRPSEAERRARGLLAIHPGAGMLWKILSVALLRQGKDALQALRRTTELMPEDAEAHGNLGAALCDQGQWSEALLSLERALVLRPHDAQLLVDTANATKALGLAGEAAALYQRALQLRPGLVEARNNLGNAFLELGRYADAAACYRLALGSNPNDGPILCNLGNAQRQLGNLEEAMASTRRALALDPASSVAHNNLGLILAEQGHREEAVTSFRHALRLDPGYVEALGNLGNVLRDLGRAREALPCHATAVELDPERAESHTRLGNVLLELRRVGEAAGHFRRAVALKPYLAVAHVSLATALRLQQRAAEAEASCDAALGLDPNHAEALSLRGELCADRGQFAEAQELFQRAIASKPDFAFALSSMALHRKMTHADTAWRRAAEALLAKSPALADEISLHFALGKYFDDVGCYDEAFDHYFHANERTKRCGPNYDRVTLTRRVDDLMRRFDAALLRHGGPQASNSELPVFIVGMPRSGTSLAEQILASHPAVAGAGELIFWDAAFDDYKNAADTGAGGVNGPSLAAHEYLARLHALAGGAARVVDKMPSNFLYAGFIHAALPRARIIHMQRHPIDTCLSIYFQHFYNLDPYANDLDSLAHYYGEYLRIAAHWRAVLPKTALLEVPYEALVDDQEGWTRRMLEFIGLPWDARCLEFHRAERVVITASKWQVRQKIHSSAVGRFGNYRKFLGPLQRLLSAAPARYSERGR